MTGYCRHGTDQHCRWVFLPDCVHGSAI
ncbi:MAG TPA: hypothetical protein DFK11_13630 [Lachnospiraceae bacterium]|nr:hypothetical protein [Lachnospiraceae bacterium]